MESLKLNSRIRVRLPSCFGIDSILWVPFADETGNIVGMGGRNGCPECGCAFHFSIRRGQEAPRCHASMGLPVKVRDASIPLDVDSAVHSPPAPQVASRACQASFKPRKVNMDVVMDGMDPCATIHHNATQNLHGPQGWMRCSVVYDVHPHIRTVNTAGGLDAARPSLPPPSASEPGPRPRPRSRPSHPVPSSTLEKHRAASRLAALTWPREEQLFPTKMSLRHLPPRALATTLSCASMANHFPRAHLVYALPVMALQQDLDLKPCCRYSPFFHLRLTACQLSPVWNVCSM
ncbi:hypothetical protein B0T19DRAFT_83487 [Cercophora scortea]|uniref:Uncharacterized protein n=1 Tax=Cercophora scortea TaxID=314031 RepID=A0AAE0MH75_9PEZI|nr:hypothetical protein B0T19DRAFT_83487 [Cercophora scortea]